MAVVMHLTFRDTSADQYDAVLERLKLEEDPADGGIFHVAAVDGSTLRIVDVWESPEHFQRFREARLGTALAEVGIEGEPEVEVLETHNVWNPQAVSASA